MNVPADAVAVSGSSLCRECGLCCDGSIFRVVSLQFSEVGWASSKRLPLVQHGEEVSFKQPCTVLENRANERVCGDYEHRPTACRMFECKVLARHESGELSLAGAVGLATKARTLIASIRERVARAYDGADLSAGLEALALAFQKGTMAERTAHAEILLDLGVLESLVLPAFYERRTQEKAVVADAALLNPEPSRPPP